MKLHWDWPKRTITIACLFIYGVISKVHYYYGRSRSNIIVPFWGQLTNKSCWHDNDGLKQALINNPRATSLSESRHGRQAWIRFPRVRDTDMTRKGKEYCILPGTQGINLFKLVRPRQPTMEVLRIGRYSIFEQKGRRWGSSIIGTNNRRRAKGTTCEPIGSHPAVMKTGAVWLFGWEKGEWEQLARRGSLGANSSSPVPGLQNPTPGAVAWTKQECGLRNVTTQQ
jgi:hypothetical protein